MIMKATEPICPPFPPLSLVIQSEEFTDTDCLKPNNNYSRVPTWTYGVRQFLPFAVMYFLIKRKNTQNA